MSTPYGYLRAPCTCQIRRLGSLTTGPGSRFADVRWVAETGSTNADALALARAGGPEGIVVVADHQTAGRGRQGRSWTAPPGASLLASILLRPPAAVVDTCTMAVAVAAGMAVHDVAGFSPRLKWPNDLVWPGDGSASRPEAVGHPGRGRLADRRPGRGGGGHRDQRQLAHRAARGAGRHRHRLQPRHATARWTGRTSSWRCCATSTPSTSRSWPRATAPRCWPRGGQRSATLGRRVRVELGTEAVVGLAVDVTGDGHLVVEPDDGERRTIAVGDVIHLRDA